MRLNVENINQRVRSAQYAVRGELAVKSEEFRARLAKGDKTLPFEQVISANIGNPQQLDQKPITFFRQVCTILENPTLLEKEDVLVNGLGYKPDVIERAKYLLKHVGSVGAYSASSGVPAIKESVAKFLESKHTMIHPIDALYGLLLTTDQDVTASLLTLPISTCPVVPRLASTRCSTSSARTATAVS